MKLGTLDYIIISDLLLEELDRFEKRKAEHGKYMGIVNAIMCKEVLDKIMIISQEEYLEQHPEDTTLRASLEKEKQRRAEREEMAKKISQIFQHNI